MSSSQPNLKFRSGPLGVLLAGGQGRRMGGDKVLVEMDCPLEPGSGPERRDGSRRLPLGALVLAALSPCCATLAISIARGTREARRDLPGRLGFPQSRLIEDIYPDHGPLAGLLTALEEAAEIDPAEPVFVAACDYPLLTPHAVDDLVQMFRRHGWDAAIPLVDGRPHPLCGVWSPGALPKVMAYLQSGGRKVTELAELLHVGWMTESQLDEPEAFFNVNTAGDLLEAQRRLAAAMSARRFA